MEKQVKGVAHAAFNVSDMDKAVQFYHDVFGSQFIELFYGGVNPQEYKDGNIGYSHICFEVEDINKTAEQIVKAGAVLDSPVSQGLDKNWQCWTHDPDNNRIELMQMEEESLQNQFLREHKL